MPTVSDVLAEKGEHMYCIEASATVLEATRKMNEHKIGALVVTNEGRVVGMFTERDVLRRVVTEEKAPSKTIIANVMTEDVICCQPEMDLDEVAAVMKDRRIRHVPVCDDDGKLHGMISIGDVNAAYATHQQSQIHFLNDYIYGRA
jgi:CBS domain-containing protein